MLNIVLPMAGRGSRFANAGYSKPKPFIDVCGKPMIEVVVNNLKPKCEHRFIFICQKEHIEKYQADKLLQSLVDNPIIIGIDYVTEGQLCSALLAKEFINSEEPVLTANTDQYIDFDVNKFLIYSDKYHLDGLIMTMFADNPKWSYARLDKESQLVVETAEKRVISNEATVGIYWFRRGKDFVVSGERLIREDQRVGGEFYICPVYNTLIKEGRKIGVYNIGKEGDGMYGLGVPSDLEYFLNAPVSKRLRETE